MEASRWLIAILALLCAISLMIWGRGLDHHRGDEVGSLSHQIVAGQGHTL